MHTISDAVGNCVINQGVFRVLLDIQKIVTGKLTEKSYIPSGLTKAQYEKIRAESDKKKAANYQKNVAKAGVFEDYTEFYVKRGTEVNGSWMNLPNLGHRMAKTKYDWSGDTVRCFCHPYDCFACSVDLPLTSFVSFVGQIIVRPIGLD